VNEGLQYLTKAVELNPTYDDAMQYLQLTYRRKADLECGDDAAQRLKTSEPLVPPKPKELERA
jgi:hypothetical protein